MDGYQPKIGFYNTSPIKFAGTYVNDGYAATWTNSFWNDFWDDFGKLTDQFKIASQPYTIDNTWRYINNPNNAGDYWYQPPRQTIISDPINSPFTIPGTYIPAPLNPMPTAPIFPEYPYQPTTIYPQNWITWTGTNMPNLIANKERLAEAVIALLGDKDYIFGGYVRDKIAEVPFNDLDIFLYDPKATETGELVRRSFFKKLCDKFGAGSIYLKKAGIVNDYKSSAQDDENTVDTYRDKLIITSGAIKLEVDLVTNVENDPFFDYDCDINAVLMRRDGTIEAAPKGDLKEITQHIKDKVWVPWDEMPKYRIEDFNSRGYKVAKVNDYRGLPGLITTNEGKKNFSDLDFGEITEKIFNGGGMQLTRNNKRVKKLFEIWDWLCDPKIIELKSTEELKKWAEESKEHYNKLVGKFSQQKEFIKGISNVSGSINDLINFELKKRKPTESGYIWSYPMLGVQLKSNYYFPLDSQSLEQIKRECLRLKEDNKDIIIKEFVLTDDSFWNSYLLAIPQDSCINALPSINVSHLLHPPKEEKESVGIDFDQKKRQDKRSQPMGPAVVFNPITGPQIVGNKINEIKPVENKSSITKEDNDKLNKINKVEELANLMRAKGLILDNEEATHKQKLELLEMSDEALSSLEKLVKNVSSIVPVINVIQPLPKEVVKENKNNEEYEEFVRELTKIWKEEKQSIQTKPPYLPKLDLKWEGTKCVNDLAASGTEYLIGLNETNILKFVLDPTNKGWKEKDFSVTAKIDNTPLYYFPDSFDTRYGAKIYCNPALDTDTVLTACTTDNNEIPLWTHSFNLKTQKKTTLNQPAPPVIKQESQVKMDEEVTFLDTLKDDAQGAAYRVASTQMTKAVKTALVKLLQQKGTKKSQLNAFKEFLDTEAGDAIVSMLMGAGLTFVPTIKDDPRAQQLAKEFRVNGMAIAANSAINALMGEFLPTILQTLQTLPQPEKVRIVEKETPKIAKKDHVEEEHRAEAEVAELKAVPNHKVAR